MSNTEPRPKVPNTMPYTEDERALARKVRSTGRERQGMSLKTKIGIGLASLGLAGTAGFVGKSLSGGGEATPAPRAPEASAPVTPGAEQETPTAPEQETSEETTEFGISAAEVGNDPEKFAEAYYSQLNTYLVAGATEKAANADRRFEIGMDEYISEISAPVDEDFIDSMFVPEWQENPKLATYVESLRNVANITRRVRIHTYSGGTDNVEPYVREFIVDNAEIYAGDPNKVTIHGHGHDNRDMNTAEDLLEGDVPNTETLEATFTTTVVDGKKLISNISY